MELCIDSPYTKQLIIEKQYNTISQYLLFSPSSFLFIRFGISTRKCSILNSRFRIHRHVFEKHPHKDDNETGVINSKEGKNGLAIG